MDGALAGHQPRDVLATLNRKTPNNNLTLRDVTNAMATARAELLQGKNAAEAVVARLNQEEVIYHYTQDTAGHLEDFIIITKRAVEIYKETLTC